MKVSPSVKEIVLENKFIGYVLKADFCAEHELGIKDMMSKFGIEKTSIKEQVEKESFFKKVKFGFKKNTSTDVLDMLETKKGAYLFTKNSYIKYTEEKLKKQSNNKGSWDETNFIIYSENKENIKELLEASKNKDLSITIVSGDNPFGGGGLAIMINSRIPKEQKDEKINSEKKLAEIYRKVKKTGIEKLLKDNEKSYFALSPSLKEDGSLILWLNPVDQKNNNSGWYSIEELKQWVNNEGPIPNK